MNRIRLLVWNFNAELLFNRQLRTKHHSDQQN